jgi:hypothetical protein
MPWGVCSARQANRSTKVAIAVKGCSDVWFSVRFNISTALKNLKEEYPCQR